MNKGIRHALRRSRKSITLLLSLVLLIVLTGVAAVTLGLRLTDHGSPEFIARVNGEAITRAELERVHADLLEIRRNQGDGSGPIPDAEVLEDLAIETLVQRQLMLQEAARRGLSISGGDLDMAIAELRSRFADLDSLGAWMQERGLGDMSLFETVRGDLLVRRITGSLVSGVQLAEDEVAAYYENHKENLIVGEQVRLRIIAVDSAEESEAIIRALRDGVRFELLAQKHSIGQLAAEGGDTGWVDPHTLPSPLRGIVSSLQEGEASRPVRKSDDEFLIVALAGRRTVRASSLDEARLEISRRLLPARKKEAVTAWLAQQRQLSEIEVY